MRLRVQTELVLPDDLDRVMSKGLDLSTFYAIKGNSVTIIKNGRTRTKDMPNAIIERLCGKRSNYTKMDLPPMRHMWDTFYDTANGESVDSMDKMRDRERNGQVFCSPDEASREANKNRREIETKTRQANSQEFRASMRETLRRTGTVNELRKMKRGY